jgi:AcrR family transcriptional regulator
MAVDSARQKRLARQGLRPAQGAKRRLDAAGAQETVSPPALRARRGRPPLLAEPERRQLLLDAAESVFLELGYSSSSMDDIARRAGMSKKTLYRLFDTKESLFAAVVAGRRAVLNAMIEAEDCSDADAPDDVLRRFIGNIARFVLAPRQASIYRLVIAESHRAPEIAHAFHREGPSKARAMLTEWLRVQDEKGLLRVPDAAAAASMLISMVIADPQMCLLVGEIRPPEDAMIAERVNRAVDLFLRGALPRAGKKERGPASEVLYHAASAK